MSRELRESYDGRPILYKHATYQDFLSWATEEQKKYFTFGGIRNPLDDAVSLYFKLLNDHREAYSSLEKASWFTRLVYMFRWRQFRFAQAQQAEFSSFFLKFYRWPYDNWSCISHRLFDDILRFETLTEDFARVVSGFGAVHLRALPIKNKTAVRAKHFSEYYDDKAIARAKWVFAVFMDRWGYDFPREWGAQDTLPSPWNLAVHGFLSLFRRLYWTRLRPAIYARTVRQRREERKARSTTI